MPAAPVTTSVSTLQLATEPIPFEDNQIMPALVSQDDFDDILVCPRYNPRSSQSRANSVVFIARNAMRKKADCLNSDINPYSIPGIKIRRTAHKYINGLATANHALQICQPESSIDLNLPAHYFACTIIDNETGKLLELCHLIKMDKYRDVWMNSFAQQAWPPYPRRPQYPGHQHYQVHSVL